MAETEEPPEGCMVDTNVLVYATVDAAPKCDEARRWMAHLQQEGIRLLATPQIYREYLVALTRGPVFEREFTPEEATTPDPPHAINNFRAVREYYEQGRIRLI